MSFRSISFISKTLFFLYFQKSLQRYKIFLEYANFGREKNEKSPTLRERGDERCRIVSDLIDDAYFISWPVRV